jgi:hypothetical protein
VEIPEDILEGLKIVLLLVKNPLRHVIGIFDPS